MEPVAAMTEPGGTRTRIGLDLHHVAIQTDDLDGTLAWYEDYLGMEVTWTLDSFSETTRSRLPGIVRLSEITYETVRLHVFEVSDHSRRGPGLTDFQYQHLALAVSAPEALTELRDRWYLARNRSAASWVDPRPPSDVVTDPDGMQSLYVLDPNGLEIEFSYFPPPEPAPASTSTSTPTSTPTSENLGSATTSAGTAEPLVLPATGHPYSAVDASRGPARPTTAVRRPYPLSGVHDIALTESMYATRWLRGHQLSFLLWRFVADILDTAPATPADRDLDRISVLVSGYSAALVYAAAMPQEHYQRCVRPGLAARHSAFSGGWAPDFAPVRRLTTGRLPWQQESASPSSARLAEAVATNHSIHKAVAERLVPRGPSLLQSSRSEVPLPDRSDRGALFDETFCTRRGSVTRAEVEDQLLGRVDLVADDLATHGLYASEHLPPDGSLLAAWSRTHSIVQELDRCAVVGPGADG